MIDSHNALWQPFQSCRQGVQLYTTLVPCDMCMREHLTTDLVMNRLLQLAAAWSSHVAVVEKLQRAQNSVAHVICQQRTCVHASY